MATKAKSKSKKSSEPRKAEQQKALSLTLPEVCFKCGSAEFHSSSPLWLSKIQPIAMRIENGAASFDAKTIMWERKRCVCGQVIGTRTYTGGIV